MGLILLALAVTGVGGAERDGFTREGKPKDRAFRDSLEGKPPPALQARDWVNTDGITPKVAAFKGKVVVINVWATWCGGCRRAVPEVKRLYGKYRDRGLVLLGIHTTRGGDKAAGFVRKKEIPWPVAVDDHDKTVASLGAVSGKPDYYLVDRKGVLRFADLEEFELERAVKMLLDERP
jgi:thiol-disulfide isomerase/thioredoxin